MATTDERKILLARKVLSQALADNASNDNSREAIAIYEHAIDMALIILWRGEEDAKG